MLQTHSLLWNYLWVAPNALLLALAMFIWRRGLGKAFPVFLAFAILSAAGQLTVFFADLAPSVSAENFWRIDWICLLTEGTLKFVLIADIFARAFDPYPSLAKLGKNMIRGVGAMLVATAALAAAYAPQDSPYGLINGLHLLEQTIYLIESGLLVFIFLFASYFRLSLSRQQFGIALGLSISSFVHLAAWAVVANSGPSDSTRAELDIVTMATYHVCVLLWFYCLLVPGKVAGKSAVPLPEHNLEVWNRELERLFHS